MDSHRDEESSPLLFPRGTEEATTEKISERKFSVAFKAVLAFSMAALLVLCVLAYQTSSGIFSNENYIDVVKSTDLQTQVNGRQDFMCMGNFLAPGQDLYSSNGQVRLAYQSDGNLVIYNGGRVLWSPNCYGSGAQQAILQTDGNFVVYAPRGAKWASGTNRNGYLVMQNDGNLVLYNPDGQAYWASGSNKLNVANSNSGGNVCFAPPTRQPTNPPTLSPTQGVQAFNGNSGSKGSGYSGDGQLNVLERHDVNCGAAPLQGFQLQRRGSDIQIGYECASTNNVATSTYGYDTGYQQYGGVVYLDRQNAFCPTNPPMFMNQYRGILSCTSYSPKRFE